MAILLIGRIEGNLLASENQQNAEARRKAEQEEIKRFNRVLTLAPLLRPFVTPSKALHELKYFQDMYSAAETNLTVKIRSNPGDTNMVNQLNEVRRDAFLTIAVKQEVCSRVYQQYTATNALANVGDPDLRAALLMTTNNLTVSQKILLQGLSTPEATQKRKQLLTGDWRHLQDICRDSSMQIIKDWAPVVPKPSSQQETSPGTAPIPADFKLPKPD